MTDRPPPQERVHDPRILRAIAHPVRNRILGELSASGPSRAADLASDLDIPANQASFHLRQLAKYGLVVEAPEQARDRRDRVWRVADQRGLAIDTGAMEEAPGGKAAVGVFNRSSSAWARQIVDAAYFGERLPGTQRTISNYTIRLTKDEAQQLSSELDDVVQQWSDRTRGRDPERRTYVLLSMLLPHPPTQGEGPDSDG